MADINYVEVAWAGLTGMMNSNPTAFWLCVATFTMVAIAMLGLIVAWAIKGAQGEY